MTQRLLIKRELLERLGTDSLQGMALRKGFTPGKLVIVFECSSVTRCRENGGPELVVVPDHIPFVIVQSILQMQKAGWEITAEQELN